MKTSHKLMLGVNIAFIAAIFALNYVYQANGFDRSLKCLCSGLFAVLGLINLVYALAGRQTDQKFSVGMAAGLLLAFLGDCLIDSNFIAGAATFALGHVCFVAAYCFMQKMQKMDYLLSGGLFLGCLVFLLFCPLLTFDAAIFRVVCIVYALIISTMLGKAVGDLIRDRNSVTAVIAFASALFFFSDLMLVFDWFIGRWSWTSNACMGTYYPALCLLALSMCLSCIRSGENNRSTDAPQKKL